MNKRLSRGQLPCQAGSPGCTGPASGATAPLAAPPNPLLVLARLDPAFSAWLCLNIAVPSLLTWCGINMVVWQHGCHRGRQGGHALAFPKHASFLALGSILNKCIMLKRKTQSKTCTISDEPTHTRTQGTAGLCPGQGAALRVRDADPGSVPVMLTCSSRLPSFSSFPWTLSSGGFYGPH